MKKVNEVVASEMENKVVEMLEEKNLSKQIYIYSISTDNFMNDDEHELHSEKQSLTFCKNKHMEELNKLGNKKSLEQKDIDKYLTKRNEIKNDEYNEAIINYFLFYVDAELEQELFTLYLNGSKKKEINRKKKELFKSVNERIDLLDGMVKKQLDKHEGIRTLRKGSLNDKNKIAQFESALTRTLNVEDDETKDIIMIRTFHYSVFKNLVEHGFKGEFGVYYRYFTSSAGAIRNKKSIFIKETVFEKIKNKLFAGLTTDKINERGGMNVNKWNAYTALTMTASIPFHDFCIDKCIVVEDFETDVWGEVDHINSETYEIKRIEKNVPIPHTDGAGIMLTSVSNKAMQIRMPYFKGLLIPTNIHKFLESYDGASPKVKDIYNKEWDIIKDEISIIFTKSQFKAWKFFINENDITKSWDDYKATFKKYQCEASIASTEQEDHDDKTLSYQVLQTLTDMSDEQLTRIASRTRNDIDKMGNDLDVMMEVLGVTDNENKNSFQQALEIYPNLLNDVHSKEVIRDTRKSMIKRAMAGKLLLDGNKRTFIAPDVYAFMQWLFAKEEKPTGLLADGQVSCRLYEDEERLNVLRSPHLYREHSLNQNVINDDTKEYFITDCIYTSTHSLISKCLMFDVDGDEALIVNQSDIVDLAEKQMENIVPLDYELGTAKADEITNPNIYKSLISAYEKNIGEGANTITRCWNSDVWSKNDEKAKEEAIRVIRWLTFENNATIDYAKTLWMPERPDDVDEIIKKYTGGRTPHFFIYSKDKKEKNVAAINNSVVNRLNKNKIIPSTRKHIKFEEVIEGFDYTKLLYNSSVNIEGKLATDIIKTYDELNKNKHWEIKKQAKLQDKSIKKVEFHVIKKIRNELRKIKNDDIYITDVLVKYLYEKESENKTLLWDAFGSVIVWNLKRNVQEVVECLDCGCEVDKTKQRQIRCECCQKERNKYMERIRKQKSRAKKKVS
ncbi:hypothetical protein ACJ2A9_04930 [Anaerobacillus sp. MEB173]|uniref:hypothetical protein n=1 Tax=Anaerobacillus sp. MEB173 TaxID=3383345 RepID=UPI003F8ED488